MIPITERPPGSPSPTSARTAGSTITIGATCAPGSSAAIDGVDDELGAEVGVDLARCRGLRRDSRGPPACPRAARAAPSRRRAARRRRRASRGAPRGCRARRGSGARRRRGSTARGRRRRLRRSLRGRRAPARPPPRPRSGLPSPRRRARGPTNQSGSRAPRRPSRPTSAARSSLAGRSRTRDAEPLAEPARHGGQRHALAQHEGADEMEADVAIPEREPASPPSRSASSSAP